MSSRFFPFLIALIPALVGAAQPAQVTLSEAQRAPLPRGTEVSQIASSDRNIWFLSPHEVYVWSGEGVRRFELPKQEDLARQRNLAIAALDSGTGLLLDSGRVFAEDQGRWNVLPVPEARAMAARDGLWLLTTENRVLYLRSVQDAPSLAASPEAPVAAMTPGAGHELWFATADRALWRVTPEGREECVARELPADVVSLVSTGTGSPLLALADGSIWRYETGSLSLVLRVKPSAFLLLSADARGRLVASPLRSEADATAATAYDGFGETEVTVADLKGNVRYIAADSHGVVWLGTVDGAFRVDGTAASTWSRPAIGDASATVALVNAKVSGTDGPARRAAASLTGVGAYAGGRVTVLNSSRGLPNNNISCIVSDGWNTWFTSGFVNQSPENGSLPGAGIIRWNHREFTHITAGLPSPTVQACAWDAATGYLYFGTAAGAVRYKDGNIVPVGPQVPIYDIAVGANAVWLAGEGSVTRLNAASAGVEGSYALGRVTSVEVDASGTVWVGTATGLRRFNGSSFVADGAGSVASGYVMALESDASNNLWISIYNEPVVRRSAGGAYTTFAFGPVFSGLRRVYGIGKDSSGNLWFGHSNFGAIGTPNAAATFLAADQVNSSSPSFQAIGTANGLPNNAALAFGAERDGVWIGTPGAGVWRIGGPFDAPGWPQPLSAYPSYSSPLLVDLDHDRDLEIVAAESQGKIFAFRPDGTTLWTFDTASAVPPGSPPVSMFVESSPAAGDVDGDGEIDIVVGLGGIFARDGRPAQPYGGVLILSRTGQFKRRITTFDTINPLNDGPSDGLPESVFTTPVLANVDADPELEIMAGALDNMIYAWNGDGTPIYQKDDDGDGRYDEDALGDVTPYTFLVPGDDAPGIKGVDDDGDGQIDEGPFVSDDDEDGKIDEDYWEWPYNARDTIIASGLVTDLAGTGEKQIIFGHDYTGGTNQEFSRGGVLRVLTPQGQTAFGFPKGDLEQVIWSSPVAVDLDGDGKYEILHGSGIETGTFGTSPADQLVGRLVYAWRFDGRAFKTCAGQREGCFATTEGRSFASFAVGDLNNDGSPELVIATMALRNRNNQLINSNGGVVNDANAVGQQLYAFTATGALLPGFPVRPNPAYPSLSLVSSPVLADIDNDGFLDIILGVRQGLMVFDRMGRVIPGAGVWESLQDDSTARDFSTTPAVADIDLDGVLELVWTGASGAEGGLVHVVKLGPSNGTYRRSWPQWRRGAGRNAIFGPLISIGQAWESAGTLRVHVQALQATSGAATVVANLAAVGGSAAQSMTAVENSYYLATASVGALAPGRYAIPVTVTDGSGRTDTLTVLFVKRSVAGAQLVASTSALNFGSVRQGETGVLRVTLLNTGAGTVAISGITTNSAEFKVAVPASYPQSIAPGGSLLVTVRYRPGPASGTRNAILTVASNAGPVAVGLTGTVPTGNAGCSVTLTKVTPNITVTDNVPFKGQSGVIRLVAAPAGCAWTASSDRPWFSIFPTSGTGNIDMTYTVYPNATVRPRSARLNVNGTTLFLTQDQAGQNEDERFVALMYQAAFGRYPTDLDLQVHMGTMTDRVQKAAEFFFSPEFDLTGRYIAGAYQGLLRRLPEYNGWLFIRNAMSQRVINQQTLASNFLISEEFNLLNPPLNNEQFIRLLYRDVLGRPGPPSSGEVTFHLDSLKAGALPDRAQKATEFLLVPEFTSRIEGDMTTTLLYFLFLQRDPTPGEYVATRARITGPESVRQIIREMIASAEFRALLI